jgi:DNA-binding GntR family transcriptional regulator
MPLPIKEPQINRQSIRDDVYVKLLNWIMEGVLRPGEKIVDKDLAEHLGVSRTPVREALRRLEDKGLVESSANRWTRISTIPPKEPEMIYPVIWTLEKLALSEAAPRLGEKDFKKMELANEALNDAFKSNDPIAASKADSEFHGIFIRRSDNDILIDMLEQLKIRYRRLEVNYFEGTAYWDSSIKEHTAIVSALRSQDLSRADSLIHSNWKRSLERFRTLETGRGENEN